MKIIFLNSIEISNQLLNGITLNDISFIIRGFICMPTHLHYTCFIINNKYNYLGLSLNKTLYHDCMKNKDLLLN